jgi:hypothetical protein
LSVREKLPYIDLRGFKGLFTKSSPDVLEAEQLRVCENADFFEKYGALSKIKGNKRILTTPYTEDGVRQPISWISFYKQSNLAGQILRHTLVAAGSIIARVEDDGSLTTLATGRTSGLFATDDQLNRFMFITNQDPDDTGRGDDNVKYDGAVLTNWGVTPPGSQEVVRESFYLLSNNKGEDDHEFVPVNASISSERDITWDGEALRVDKTDNVSGNFHVEKQFYPPFNPFTDHLGEFDDRDIGRGTTPQVKFQLFIPRGGLTGSITDGGAGLSNSNEAFKVWASPDESTVENNAIQFYFPIASLLEGWNTIALDFRKNPDAQIGRFYPEGRDVQRMRFEFFMENRTQTLEGIRLDRMVTVDQGAPVLEAQGSGSFTGAYQYKVVFVSKYGQLSNAGPATPTLTATSAAQIKLTKIPLSKDPQVVARRIYRTVANGSVFLFQSQIDDNSTTALVDATPDGDLSDETPPQAGDFSDDNGVPPRAGIVKIWKRTVFMAGDPQNPETLYFSEDDEPESFPLINAFQLDDKITAMYETYSGLVVETETGKWQVAGDNPDFSVDKIVDGMGCVGRRAAGETRLVGYAMDRDGMRLFDLSSTEKISEPIRDKFDTDINKENIELAFTTHSKSRNSLLQFNPDGRFPIPRYNSIFKYQYGVDDIYQGWWNELKPPSALNFLDAVEIEDANGDFKIYAGAEDGMVYELFNKDTKS